MDKFAYLITCDDRVTKVTPREGNFFYLDELWNYCDGYVDSVILMPGVRVVFSDKPFVGSMFNRIASLLFRSEVNSPILVYQGYKTFFDTHPEDYSKTIQELKENKDGKQ